MTVTGSTRTLAVRNILAGEVWVVSGQSNMEWGLRWARDGKREVERADYPEIRRFNVPNVASPVPLSDVSRLGGGQGGGWSVCSPRSAAIDFWSAVGYFFARDLHGALRVPVGLIQADRSGTRGDAWVSRRAMRSERRLKGRLDRLDQALRPPPPTPEELAERHAAWNAEVCVEDPGNAGFPRGWADPDHDTSEWEWFYLPRTLEASGRPIDGIVWFRRDVDVPASWVGTSLTLCLGPVDDCDITYFNGVEVGRTGLEVDYSWSVPRVYTIPAAHVRQGRNTIAVRVLDRYSNGGIAGDPEQMRLQAIVDATTRTVALAGPWRYRAELERLVLSPYPPAPVPPGGRIIGSDYPTVLHNGMIAPLERYPVRGVVWYQGESDVYHAEDYRVLLPALIRDWRRGWRRPDMPFVVVQLPAFGPTRLAPGEGRWAKLRDAQLAALEVPHTALVVTIDLGHPERIHPRNKQEVGRRAALAARAIAYGQQVVHSGPVYRSHETGPGSIRVRFDHVGGGLASRDGAPLRGFAVAGDDRRFVWAQAEIDGDTVVVSSPLVREPVALRYAWADNPPDPNLINHEGLPASPFRTDRWPTER